MSLAAINADFRRVPLRRRRHFVAAPHASSVRTQKILTHGSGQAGCIAAGHDEDSSLWSWARPRATADGAHTRRLEPTVIIAMWRHETITIRARQRHLLNAGSPIFDWRRVRVQTGCAMRCLPLVTTNLCIDPLRSSPNRGLFGTHKGCGEGHEVVVLLLKG